MRQDDRNVSVSTKDMPLEITIKTEKTQAKRNS